MDYSQMQYGMPNMPNMSGYMYQGMPAPQPKFNNTLTGEEIEDIQKNGAQFSIRMTREEYLRGICNHRSPDGMSDMLVEDPATGEVMCKICGHKFMPIDPDTSLDAIRDQIKGTINILQTIKLMYVDLPTDAGREFFQVIPLMEKIVPLFEFAAKNFASHEINSWQYRNGNPTVANMFNNLVNMFGNGGMMGQPNMMMGGNPMMGGMPPQPMNPAFGQQMQMGNPAFSQQFAGYPNAAYQNPGPQPNMMAGQPTQFTTMPTPAMQSNGFGFIDQSQQQAGFAYKPPVETQPATPTVPTAPAAAPAVDVVESTVKA